MSPFRFILFKSQHEVLQTPAGGRGVRAVYMNLGGGGGGEGSMRVNVHIANPKKYMSLKFYTPKNTKHQNFLLKTTQDLEPKFLSNTIVA